MASRSGVRAPERPHGMIRNVSLGCGGGAKSKGALYRETLQTTGFYVGRIVIVTREFTPIPSPATPLPLAPGIQESSRNAVREACGIYRSDGIKAFPNRSAVPPPVGRPRGSGWWPHREFTMRFCRRLLSFAPSGSKMRGPS